MQQYNIGSIVQFRGREWVVMPGQDEEIINLRPISGGEKDACGVFFPLEGNQLKPSSFPVPKADDFGDFEAARLMRDAARLMLRNGAGPFRSFGHLKNFRPRPYQLVPLMMALKIQPVRMLIADDVGVGKTIEAGLIARELLDRGDISRLAIVCPSYLCDQWQQELYSKFNINAKIIRANTLARLERELPRPSLSVFEYFPHFITSIDYIKSDRRRDAFLQHAPEFVIVDEAHSCAKPASQSGAQQQRHRLISDLSENQTRNLLLVTATPHSGFDQSFQSLLHFIRPEFSSLDLDRLEKSQREELAKHFVQRRRKDVEQWMDTETEFPERIPIEVPFQLSPVYNSFFEVVYRFAREVVVSDEQDKAYRRRVRFWAALALLRCVMSSPAAAKAALNSRLDRANEENNPEMDGYISDIYDPTEIESAVDTAPSHIVYAVNEQLSEGERRKLHSFVRQTEALKDENDTKVDMAEQEIRKLLKDNHKPIIFCRFIATAEYVAEELKKRLSKDYPKLHIISVTGALSEEERVLRVDELGEQQQRILVATDCLSEGINLQENFNAVLHYDLPWNPNRLEQREGRVDRFGQKSKLVKAIVLYGSDNPVDGAVLNVLLRKARKIHKSLGITVPLPQNSESVMDAILHALFLRGGQKPQMSLFDSEAPIVKVNQDLDRAADRQKKSRTLFAQHAIKPDEVAKELERSDKIFGGPEIVQRFVTTALQRFGAPLKCINGHWELNSTLIPNSIRRSIDKETLHRISFDLPREENVTFISRNHPLVLALSESIMDSALSSKRKVGIGARFSVIRSNQVEIATTLLLYRLRFILKNQRSNLLRVAEECLITGYIGTIQNKEWINLKAAESLFERIIPSSNIVASDVGHWLSNFLNEQNEIQNHLEKIGEERANELHQSFNRINVSMNAPKQKVESLMPADLISVMIALPEPRV